MNMLTDESIKLMGEDDSVMPPMPNGKANRDARSKAKRASCTNCRQSKVAIPFKRMQATFLTPIGEMQCRRGVPSAVFELSKAA